VDLDIGLMREHGMIFVDDNIFPETVIAAGFTEDCLDEIQKRRKFLYDLYERGLVSSRTLLIEFYIGEP
jgi:hypothetical protein